MENGKENGAEKKPKPKYSIHDYKPKKRYTREEKEMMEAGMDLVKKIGELKERGEIDISDFR